MKISRSLSMPVPTAALIACMFFVPSTMLSPSASNAAVVHKCGAPISSIVKTEIAAFTTGSTSFVNVPGASAKVTVPAGATRCVKVRFSAEASCSQTGVFDLCALRVVVPGVVTFDPPINGVNFVVENNNLEARSFEWVKILEAGVHTVVVQAGVQVAGTTFSIPIWTLDVEVAK